MQVEEGGTCALKTTVRLFLHFIIAQRVQPVRWYVLPCVKRPRGPRDTPARLNEVEGIKNMRWKKKWEKSAGMEKSHGLVSVLRENSSRIIAKGSTFFRGHQGALLRRNWQGVGSGFIEIYQVLWFIRQFYRNNPWILMFLYFNPLGIFRVF